MNTSPPIEIILPDFSEQRIRAVLNLTAAVADLAKVLNTQPVQVTVRDVHIDSHGSGPGISIQTKGKHD